MAANGKSSNGYDLGSVLQADADKGRVAVHSFDENASPAEKGAQAGQAKDQLKSIRQKNPPPELGMFCIPFCHSNLTRSA